MTSIVVGIAWRAQGGTGYKTQGANKMELILVQWEDAAAVFQRSDHGLQTTITAHLALVNSQRATSP